MGRIFFYHFMLKKFVYLNLCTFVITDLCPSCAAYYGNRAATYIMLNRYRDALEDARQSTRLDSNFVKVAYHIK